LGAIQELRGKYTNIIFISNAEGTGDEDQTLGGEHPKESHKAEGREGRPSVFTY